jgi:putative oxidoreductase
MRNYLFLSSAQRFSDVALLLLRVFVGLFLIANIWDRVASHQEMQAFAGFLAQHHFPNPEILAPVSAYSQLLIGMAFVLGLFTRWAGIICAVNFAIAIAMVDIHGGMRAVFPAGCLVVIGLYLATHGAGRLSLDAALRANEVPRAKNAGVRLKK